MPKDYADRPRTQLRRKDRAITEDDAIRALLHRAPMAVLATVHDGQPFAHSNLFAYDEAAHCIYMHTARVGRTRANVGTEAPVCLSVSEMGRLLPADEALEFSVEYAGVTVFGQAAVVAEAAEARHALQLILDKYAPHLRPVRDYRPVADDELRRTAVYRIRIGEWSGKRKQAAPDFPGAYFYEEVLEDAAEA
jgi:nitroimidazol reductase NimA-like FMN-containing flavoprotein (pyridoxamine 5'-phosphate oxidase superfamily)